MNEPRHINQNSTPIECEKIGVLEAVYIDTQYADGTCFGTVHLAGLCPRCKESIGFHLTNGGKLSAARTLRLEHIFSGDIRCEDESTTKLLAELSGEQKAKFFQHRHNEKTLRDAGFDEAAIQKRLVELDAK